MKGKSKKEGLWCSDVFHRYVRCLAQTCLAQPCLAQMSSIDAFDAHGKPTGGAQLFPAVAADGVSWNSVRLHSPSIVGISGGFNHKPCGADYIDVPVGDHIERFIHLSIRSEWFVKGAGGLSVKKGELQAVSVIDMIRDRLEKIYDSEEEEEDDPMKKLCRELETHNKTAMAKRSVATAKRSVGLWKKSLIEEIVVPLRPENVPGKSSAGIKIVVYTPASGQTNFSRRPVYLRVDALDWLLQFAADELFRPRANCAAVAGLFLQWNCTSKAWQAEFVSGPRKGTKRRFGVCDLTKDRVNKIEKAGILKSDTTSGMEAHIKLKQQARDVMVLWCAAISQGNDSFEVDFDLKETVGPACTPVTQICDTDLHEHFRRLYVNH